MYNAQRGYGLTVLFGTTTIAPGGDAHEYVACGTCLQGNRVSGIQYLHVRKLR